MRTSAHGRRRRRRDPATGGVVLTAVTAEALAQAGSELDHARSEAAAVCDAAEAGLVDDLVNTQLDHPAKPL